VGTYVITGSASGIGGATRARLEKAGHSVIGVDLRDAEVIADLAQPETRRGAVDDVLARSGGRLDGLVTAAGVGPPFDAATMMSINYFGSEAFLSGLRPALAASGSAQVVAVSSNSTTAQPNIPAELVDVCLTGDEEAARAMAVKHGDAFTYAASKTAIARYVRRNAPTAEWAGAGVRLNAIAPGATLTPLLQSGLDSDEFGPLIRAFPVPTGGFGTPEQIAFWIDMLLTGEGAPFVCGAIFFVDGGTDAMVRPDAWPTTFTLE
jgi:NAD(P)-dependent dehydrogenase (short-subunit alcohol dehydrogenase family)